MSSGRKNSPSSRRSLAFASPLVAPFTLAIGRTTDLRAVLKGLLGEHLQIRPDTDLYLLAAAAKPGTAPYIYIDCGVADPFVGSNRDVVAALLEQCQGVAHLHRRIAGPQLALAVGDPRLGLGHDLGPRDPRVVPLHESDTSRATKSSMPSGFPREGTP